MWPFSKKKYTLADSGLLEGYVEWHCHVLPGVDDGVQKMEESLLILEELEHQGAQKIYFTPHVMEDVPNTPDSLRARFEELKAAYKGNLDLNLAAENMLDNLFDGRLEAGEVLPIGEHRDHLLVETSYFTPPTDLEQKLQRTFSKGFFPLLAHPERYVYMDYDDYDRLHEMGVKMQLNIYSLFGMYGPEAAAKARDLLKDGYYHVFGSDTHRLRQLQYALHHKGVTAKEIDMLHSLSL